MVYMDTNTVICHERLSILGVNDGSQPLTEMMIIIFYQLVEKFIITKSYMKPLFKIDMNPLLILIVKLFYIYIKNEWIAIFKYAEMIFFLLFCMIKKRKLF